MTAQRRRLVPTAAAALALGITESGVRQLAYRGRLTRHGIAQRALYDLDEIQQLRTGQPTSSANLDQQERSNDRP